MKTNHVTGAFAANLSETSHRILVEGTFLRHWLSASDKERRVHRPPTHDQIHEHAEWILIIKTAAHRKEKLLPPGCLAKQRRRNHVHVEERSVIGDEQQRARVINGFNILQPVHAHQVVGRNMNPAGAKEALAPGPETLPAAEIHAMRNAKSEALKGR